LNACVLTVTPTLQTIILFCPGIKELVQGLHYSLLKNPHKTHGGDIRRSSSALVAGFRVASKPRLRTRKCNYGGCNEATLVTPELIENKLKSKLKVKKITVLDTSGNGSFFQIHVEASDFNGLSTVKQHQLVNSSLKEEISQIHGLSLKTVAVPDL